MCNKSKRFTLAIIGDTMFDNVHVFLWTLVSDNGDKNNGKFTVGGNFSFIVFAEA